MQESTSELTLEGQARLVKSLCREEALGHRVDTPGLLETHISYIVLTGPYAYKIKKAVNLGFLDFTSLEQRRFFCAEELRLNRRSAPEIYLGMVPITGDIHAPRIGGAGRVIEYAVKMREFPQEALGERLLAAGKLTAGDFDRLAEAIAAFHLRADVAAPGSEFGRPARVEAPVKQNFDQLARLAAASSKPAELARLREWARSEFSRLEGVFAKRKREGFVRECHGDLHLGNLVQLNGRLAAFDCIDFNPDLRWIDVMSDVAFLVMDLDYRQFPGLAWRFLNRYLEVTGDYQGVQVLRFYGVYRALVRAKVALMKAGGTLAAFGQPTSRLDYQAHLVLAERFLDPPKPALILTHGLPGSGKSTLSQPLLEMAGAIRLRSDVERKRLHGLAAFERSASAIDAGLYTTQATAQTYGRLLELAELLLGCGYPVIVDATFLRHGDRQAFRSLAQRLSVPFAILDFQAPIEELRKRLARRDRREVSEADIEVLEHQAATQEPLASEEREYVVSVDSVGAADERSKRDIWRPLLARLGLGSL